MMSMEEMNAFLYEHFTYVIFVCIFMLFAYAGYGIYYFSKNPDSPDN